jgi:signal transduction histidine kinase
MTRWSIRVRLTVLYGGLFLLAGVILLGVTYVLVQQSLERRGGGERMFAARATERFTAAAPGVKLVLPDGRELAADQIPDEFARRQADFERKTLNSLLTQGGVALGGVAVVAVGFGWLMSERALRPVHQITATANRVAAGNFHERIALGGPNDEIRELADTFDSMLERLDRSFDGQRRFVANASHELRTPLAINRTLIEVALGRPDAPPELRQLGETLLEVNARHERLIDGLLTLAHSEQAVTAHDPVDLADIARHVAEHATPPEGPQPLLDLAPAPTAGDPVLLERIVQNLLQNALAYNAPDGWVSVSTRVRTDHATVTVANTGPVVPAYEIPGLFEPFRRLRERTGSAGGVGLGLSIVRAVARAHGGEVSALPREGGGLVVTVTLPRRLD